MPNTDQWESFCRQQVLLYSCYRSVGEAKRDFQTWSECYAELSRTTENQVGDLSMVMDEFEDESDSEGEPQEDWMMLAAMAPNFGPSLDTDLGLRSIDLRQNWTCSTIRLIINGGAGTGKSTLIHAIVHSVRELFRNDKSVRVMAPTGVAAFNIGGATIHHELAITTDRKNSYKKLETERCGRMQEEFKDTKLIIIDEYSMIGRKMLANIDLRLRDIFASSEPFGNISIVLVGDIRQLPPVFDTPLYAQGGRDLQLTGSLSYCV
ncbi:hypothetical protein MKW92_023196 [Papaver armeniacum]|nr:hypothetical protein MKW92_023196 [Papaver armeniacum]